MGYENDKIKDCKKLASGKERNEYPMFYDSGLYMSLLYGIQRKIYKNFYFDLSFGVVTTKPFYWDVHSG